MQSGQTAMKTRTSKKKPTADVADSANVKALGAPANVANPPLLFILPKHSSAASRIVTLPNPATKQDVRYYFDPVHGLYEFTRISASRSNYSSWLLASIGREGLQNESQLGSGYAIEDSSVYVATPVDVLFFLLPILVGSTQTLFVSLDDHLDKVADFPQDLSEILRSDGMSQRLHSSMSSICDVVEAGEESLYRFSASKLAMELFTRAKAIVSNNKLPRSIMQKFVDRVLKAPTSFEQSMTLVPESPLDNKNLTHDGVIDEESLPAPLDLDTPLQPAICSPESQNMRYFMTVRVTIDYLLDNYIDMSSHDLIKTEIAKLDKILDFKPLDDYLEGLAVRKKELQALQSLSDNISRKRRPDDEEMEEVRAEKRRKKEEDEAKKKSQNRNLKQLAKVDTSGMKKMSSFFVKRSNTT